MSTFQKATKRAAKARIALDGPSGSGKTMTGLLTATALAESGRIAVIDSERGSASKYADRFDFDVLELDGNFHPDRYTDAIRESGKAGYDVLLIDSLTHAWAGKGGVLEQVDAAKSRFGGNSYMAWSVGTPMWQGLIDAILAYPGHAIVTMRSKSKYVEDEQAGKKSYRRAGAEPVARDGVEYEFDVVGDLDLDHTLVISKTRCPDLEPLYRRPGHEFGEQVLRWLSDGAQPLGDERMAKLEAKLREAGIDDAKGSLAVALKHAPASTLEKPRAWERAQEVVQEVIDTFGATKEAMAS